MGKLWDRFWGKEIEEKEKEKEEKIPTVEDYDEEYDDDDEEEEEDNTPAYMEYCPRCGFVRMRRPQQQPNCEYCNYPLEEVPVEYDADYFINWSLKLKEQAKAEGRKVYIDWFDLVLEQFKVKENPLFNETLYQEQFHKTRGSIFYCLHCGNVTTNWASKPDPSVCWYCRYPMERAPDEFPYFYYSDLEDELIEEAEKRGKELEIDWKDLVLKDYKVKENPLFNYTLYQLRVKNRVKGNPYPAEVECPTCTSLNTCLLHPNGEKEYTGIYGGGISSDFGKTFVCCTCGYKW